MNIQQLQRLSPRTVTAVVESGGKDSAGLQPDAVEYILQISRASELYRDPDRSGSMLDVARALQHEFPRLSLRTARNRVSEALSYLYDAQGTTADTWRGYYADRLDELAMRCEQDKQWEAAKRCLESAAQLRIEAAANRVDPALTEYKPIIVSPDLQPDRLGLNPAALRELQTRAEQMIAQSGVSPREQQRLRHELSLETGIEDVTSDTN